MMGPIVRIVLRVIAGALIGAGYLPKEALPDVLDPALVGGIVWALTEGFYWVAKRRGWAT